MSEIMRALHPHGGKRAGAGRPEGRARDSQTARINLRVHPRVKQELERKAAEQGVSLSEFLLSAALSFKN